MTQAKTRTYKGYSIRPCERVTGEHAGRWVVQTYHDSGVPWSDEICPHFKTIPEALTCIDWVVIERKALEALG